MADLRVGLLNAVALNGGDAAIMLGIREHVRSVFGDDASLTVFDGQAGEAASYYPAVEFRLPAAKAVLRYPRTRYVGRIVRELNTRRWLAAATLYGRSRRLAGLLLRPAELRKLSEYAALGLAITTGGTYLVEHYSPWPRFFEFELVLRLGVPLVFYTQSIGEFKRPHYRRTLRDLLDASELVLLRDQRSYRHVRELDARPARMEVVADAAFALAGDHRDAYRIAADRPLRIAVSVREWRFFSSPERRSAYEAGLVELVSGLVRGRGAEVTFLSTCQGVPEYWTDDSAYAQRLADALPADVLAGVTVDRGFRTPFELMRELERFDLAVCTRFHMAILALNAGTPVLPISYEFKTREFFERIGLGEYVTDIEDADAGVLIARLERFLDRAADWRPRLLDGVANELAAVDRSRALLAEVAAAA